MKSKICILASLTLGAICPSILAQETSPGGIVYGPKASFNISAPEGWVLDTESAKGQDLPCVLYPKGSSWADEDRDVREGSQPPMGRRRGICGNGNQGNEGKARYAEAENRGR